MEDTHVWVMAADRSARREVGTIDHRQGAPEWSRDGQYLYFTMQDRGHVRLMRIAHHGGEALSHSSRNVAASGSWALAIDGTIAVHLHVCRHPPAELFLRPSNGMARPLTTLNEGVFSGRTLASVESFTFRSFDGTEIEAFLTKPLNATSTQKVPLITMIHGGPHGQQGPAFNQKAQVYAAHGLAALMVNYRGSTGYGQKLADAIFKIRTVARRKMSSRAWMRHSRNTRFSTPRGWASKAAAMAVSSRTG